MKSTLICIHGHAIEASRDADLIELLSCPLCGATIKSLGRNDTLTRALDVTFVPNSVRSSSAGKSDTVMSGGETLAGGDAAAQDPENSIDPDENGSDPDRRYGELAATADFAPRERIPKAERRKHWQRGSDSKGKVRKPPQLPDINVIEELGRGGFGVVYRAFDEKHNREVALKTLQRMGPNDLVRFKNEFRALADIAHPNLASLYELVSDGRTWCFTMEILRGVSLLEYVWSEFDALGFDGAHPRLANHVESGARFPLRRTTRLFDGLKQLVMGVNELHRVGKLHSDIKPSNVMVTTDGRVAVLDFGLIAEIERDEDGRIKTVVQGTPFYMAPEQAACRPLTEASDWYAVGVMLYELLTGRLPFYGKPEKAMLRKQYDVPVHPSRRQPGVPKELCELCMALLEIDPANRPSAADILRAVDAHDIADSLLEKDASHGILAADLVGRREHIATLCNVYSD
ncbi:MAG: serine/threonine-protein kinase, partial [Rubripirellula sp.]